MSTTVGNKSVIANSVGYTISNLLLKGFTFFLIPLYTNFLTTEEYGIINLSSGFYTLCACFITFSLQFAVVRFYVDYKNSKEKLGQMFGSTICFMLLTGGIFIVICIIFRRQIENRLFENIKFVPVILISIFIAVISAIYTTYQDILKGMQDAKKSILFSYLYFFLLLAGNIITVVFMKMGAEGVLLSTLLVYIVMFLLMLIDLRRRKLLAFCIDKEILRDMLIYSIPIIPHTLSYNVTAYVSKVTINNALSLSTLGIYSLAQQFGSISDVVLNSVQSAFQPWMFNLLSEKQNCEKMIGKITYLFMWIYGIFFVGISLFSQEAIIIMAEKSYGNAWIYVPAIVFAVAIKAPLYFYQNFLYYNKQKVKYIFISTLLSSIVNIILTVLSVPKFGIIGSIVADIISLIVRTVIVAYITWSDIKNTYSVWYLYVLVFLPIIFVVIGVLPSIIFNVLNFSWSICIYKGIIILVFMVLAVIINKTTITNFGVNRRGER